jgi:phosphomethylpyrimidine synthase
MTQLQVALKGNVSEEMKAAAALEGRPVEMIRDGIAAGRIVLPVNAGRKARGLPAPKACAIGEGMRTKVNANIGTSEDYPEVEAELVKLSAAIEAGADTVMDLSTGGDIRSIRQTILEKCPVPVGTVPIYDAAVRLAKSGGIRAMTAGTMMQALRDHVEQGVDFVTVHCGVNREVLRTLEHSQRICGIVSRGGSFLAAWMRHHGSENPYFEQYDEVLAICREQDVTISLGDGLRPGALADAMDRAQVHELNVLSELAERARAAGVQVMIEGPGHVPFHQIAAQVRLQKELCRGAPFYVLGPLVTDVAPGYDHITAAIGATAAAAAGVDFICYVTAAEHLGLPTAEHVREGVIAARIAAHAGDIAKGLPGAAEWDRRFSAMRRKRDWAGQLADCLDPVKAKALRDERRPADSDVCSMCGEFCAYRMSETPASPPKEPKGNRP